MLTTSEVETLLSNLQLKPLGMDSEEDFRISIAGAQEKTALTKTADGGWALPLGASATSHIFKTPIGSLQANTIDFSESCENEWLCLEIARNFGLPAAKTEVLRFGKQKAIVVERFDRKKSKEPKKDLLRLPTEDFCQALGVSPAQKYEADGGPGILDIMAVLKWSDDAAADQRRFMAAQVLLWLLDSTDGHAKNYSIFLEARNCYRLTPLYDVMSVAPLTATGALSPRRVKLAMGLVGRNRHYRTADIEPRHFLSTAEAAGFSRTEMTAILRDFCVKTPSVVKNIRASLPANFPKSTSEPILSILEKRAARIARFLG